MYQLFLVINHWFTLSNPFRLFPLGCPGHAPKRATQSHEFLAFKTQSMQICSFRIDHGFHQLSKSPVILNHSNSVKWVPCLFPLHGTSQVERGSCEKKKGKQLSKLTLCRASWVPFSATTPFSSTTICSASCENRLAAGCEFQKIPVLVRYQLWIKQHFYCDTCAFYTWI